MKYWLLFLSFLLVSCGSKDIVQAPQVLNQETLRQTSEGSILGFTSSTGAHVWRGVPFAADTSGKNRWRAQPQYAVRPLKH